MSEKVTLQELIDSIAEQTDESKQFTHDFLKDFVSIINGGLESDGYITIAGLGKFELRQMDEREGYNPQTGEKMTIPAHNKVVFKPYKGLRELVNAPYANLEPELIEESESDEDDREPENRDTTGKALDSGQKTEERPESDFLPTGPPASHIGEEEPGERDEPEEEGPEHGSEEGEQDYLDPFGFSEPGSLVQEDSQEQTTSGPGEELESTDENGGETDEDDDDDIVEFTPNMEEEEAEAPPFDLPEMEQGSEETAGESEEAIIEPGTDREEFVPEEEPVTSGDEETAGETDETRHEDTGAETADDDEIEEYGQSREETTYQPQPEAEETLQEDQPGKAAAGIKFRNRRTRRDSGSSFWLLVAAAFIIVLIAVLGWYLLSFNGATEDMAGSQPPAAEQQQANPTPSPADATGNQDSQTQQEQEPAPTISININGGETLWSLADEHYDNPYLWPWIYKLNRSSIENPNLIFAGQDFTIPSPERGRGGLSPADSLDVALSYVTTYQWYHENEPDDAKYYLWVAQKYSTEVFDHAEVPIDESDLAFAKSRR